MKRRWLYPLVTGLTLVSACSSANTQDEKASAPETDSATPMAANPAPPAEPTSTASPEGPLPDGTWTVMDARLTRPDGIQAVGDAELEAARTLVLAVTPSAIGWQGDAITGALDGYGFDAKCAEPMHKPGAGDRFSIQCADGVTFGPSAGDTSAFSSAPDGTVTLDWFDGITLVLRKQG